MALETMSRWEMIRELSYFRKSGTLTAQLGRSYLYWTIMQGDLICFSSTSADFSFTSFLHEKKPIDVDKLTWAQTLITDSRTLGQAVVQRRLIEPNELRNLLKDHCYEHAHLIMEPTTHLFYSPRIGQLKPQMVQMELSLSEVLLHTDRYSLEIRSAVDFSENVLNSYRVRELEAIEGALRPSERRMLPYLKSSASLAEILSDPELDRMTCYRVLFLLWVAGYIQEIQPRPVQDQSNKTAYFFSKLRLIPADWLIPLVLGILLGVVFAPEPPKSSSESTPCKSLPTNPPPWSSPN